MSDLSTKLTAEDLGVLTHSQLASAYQLKTGKHLAVDSGLSRQAVLNAIGDH